MEGAELDLLSPDLVFLDVDAKDATDLLGWLEGKLRERGLIQGTWLDAIQERERKYPTGLQCPEISVGIPHTDPQNIKKPYIAVMRPTDTVDFDPMTGDGGTVHASLVVNLGIVHSEGQVKILQLLMLTFMDKEAVADIMAANTPQGLYDALIGWLRKKEAEL